MDTYEISLGTFGDYIKEDWMKPLNLSADKLAQDLGISSAVLGKILNGKDRMPDDACRRLARYFGMNLDYFINVQSEYEFREKENQG